MRHLYLIFTVMLLAANTASAASFDCAKAGTKVEKMICADPELSTLDEELGSLYSKAMREIKNVGELKLGQKHWLQRNRARCVDMPCLKGVYEKRAAELRNILSSRFTTPDVQYPPYPDVWDAVFPLSTGERGLRFTFFKMDNGSLLTFFAKQTADDPASTFGKSFFGQGKFDSRYKYSAFFWLEFIKGQSDIVLNNGTSIALDNMDYRMGQWCPQGLNHYQKITHPDGRTEKKSLLYILDKPVPDERHDRCASVSENETHFERKVENLAGSLIPLDDGGFLLADRELGLVIRFDGKLQSQSELIGKNVFIVDTEELEKLGAFEFETINYGNMQQWVYEYLMKKKVSK